MPTVTVQVTIIQKQGRKNQVIAKGTSEEVSLTEDSVTIAAENVAYGLVEEAWGNIPEGEK